VTVRWHESPTGSMSQVIREVPSAFTSSPQSARMVCTSRRGGSTSMFSPSPKWSESALGLPHLEAAARRPVRGQRVPELVFAADLAVRDGFPEPFRSGLDVNLEDLFHGTFQSGFEVAEGSGPWFCVFTHPTIVDEADGHRIQEVQLFAAPTAGDHQSCILQEFEVLRDAETGHLEPGSQKRRQTGRPRGTAHPAVPCGWGLPRP
jgi:hypothetical protein